MLVYYVLAYTRAVVIRTIIAKVCGARGTATLNHFVDDIDRLEPCLWAARLRVKVRCSLTKHKQDQQNYASRKSTIYFHANFYYIRSLSTRSSQKTTRCAGVMILN